MTFNISSNYNYYEICEELGIPYEKFMQFIRQNNGSEDFSTDEEQKNISIKAALQMFLKNLQLKVETNKRSSETYKTYKSFLVKFCDFLEVNYNSLYLAQINEVHLEIYLNSCKPRDKKLSKYTVNTYTGILRNFISFCFNQELIYNDFRSRFEWQSPQLLPRYIPDTQLDLLLKTSIQTINGYRNHAILSVLVGTGLRISELTSLKIKDIDLNGKTIFVRKGKGDKDRVVPLYPEVEVIILDYLNVTGFKDWILDHDGYVFAKDYGYQRKNRLTINAIEKMLRRMCVRLNIEDKYTPHTLRHTFAVRCIKKGMRIEYLSQILGHSNIMTTYVYIQLLPSDLGKVLTQKYPFPFQDLLFRSLGVE